MRGVMISRVLTFSQLQHLLNRVFFEALRGGLRRRLDSTMNFSSSGEWPPPAWPPRRSERARQHRRRALDHVDEGRGDAQENQQRGGHQQRHAIRLFDGEIFGHHFADHHVNRS